MYKIDNFDFYRTNAYFCGMFRIRKVRTKSGSTAIQVVQYQGHRAKIAKHIGSCKENFEYELLLKKAQEWIDDQTSQINIFPEQKQKVLIVERGECVAVTHHFAYWFFMSCLSMSVILHICRHFCLI